MPIFSPVDLVSRVQQQEYRNSNVKSTIVEVRCLHAFETQIRCLILRHWYGDTHTQIYHIKMAMTTSFSTVNHCVWGEGGGGGVGGGGWNRNGEASSQEEDIKYVCPRRGGEVGEGSKYLRIGPPIKYPRNPPSPPPPFQGA
jgi:hypothetical protein